MSGYVVKYRYGEKYYTGTDWTEIRCQATIFDYEEAEMIAHDVGGVVLARHEAMGDKA